MRERLQVGTDTRSIRRILHSFLALIHSEHHLTSLTCLLSGLANYRCADVYCINLDTYSKLDVPTDPIRVNGKEECFTLDQSFPNSVGKCGP